MLKHRFAVKARFVLITKNFIGVVLGIECQIDAGRRRDVDQRKRVHIVADERTST